MALVVSDEIDSEAQRIITAPDNFAVLKLKPTLCSLADVTSSYDAISAILKRKEAIRNPKAAKARARLDQAKASLSNEQRLTQEKSKFQSTFSSSAIPPEEVSVLNIILNTTEMLERRVAALKAAQTAQQQQMAADDSAASAGPILSA